MKKFIVIIFLSSLVVSCTKISNDKNESFLTGGGVFILNEGNFSAGNGSLSFFSYDSLKIYNDIFNNINGRPLGDVPNSMAINGDKAYIVVNNSGKIEVVNKNTLESISTISGLISPRNISFINSNIAYVTSLYSNYVTIINLTDNSISGSINLKRSSEAIIKYGNKAFVSSWVGGKEIMVINTLNNTVIDSISVGVEPETMVLDRNNMIWVLCGGGWSGANFAELIRINTLTNKVEKRMVFPKLQTPPSCLQIDGSGETLYYLEKGVQRMKIDASVLPSAPFIPESLHYFYKIGINPVNSDIFLTDAVDYQQKGYVLYYNKDATLVSTLKTDILPGFMCFK